MRRGEKQDRGIMCRSEQTAEEAHLLFSLFLIAADLQVILQHPAHRQRDMFYCSHDLLPSCLSQYMASCDLQSPLKRLSGELINYTAKSSAGGSCWGMRKWKFTTKNLPDVQLLELGKTSQIVFSPGNFLSDNCYSQEFLGNKKTCSAEISLSFVFYADVSKCF